MQIIENFNQLNINENLKKAIADMGYEKPTPIQSQTIPFILENKDVIGQAQTGTGKTAAFSLPILERIDENDYSIQALVMCPTRELAIQVTKEIRKLGKYLEGIRMVPVYGGQSYDIQINALKKKPQIIIGTPGRIIDLMNRSLLKFHNIKYVVLDEADEMLKMGFQEDLETILKTTPSERQTVLFSATMPQPILNIANTYLKNYELVKIENKTVTVEKIEQTYYLCKNEQKFDLLVRLLDFHHMNSVIVFANTKKDVDELVLKLQGHNYVTEGLHGDLKQSQRDRVMNSFRNNNIQILVATDVAARGLDVEDIGAVINYDIPLEEEVYVHRIGRTGRAGKSGRAFTFVTKRQQYRLNQIEKYINTKIKPGKIPTINEIKESKTKEFYHIIKNHIEEPKPNLANDVVEQLTEEGYNKDQIINVLFHLLTQDSLKEYEEINEVSEQKEKNRNNRSRKSNNKTELNHGKKVLLYLNAGSRKNIKVFDILDFLKKEFKIKQGNIGNIEITKKATYVELLDPDAKKIMNSPKQPNIKNYKINAEIIR